MRNTMKALAFFVLGFVACGNPQRNSANKELVLSPIEEAILKDKKSFYYIDVEHYESGNATLPIGVFDSGTGGLTVLDALVRYDQYQNESWETGSDEMPDFSTEKFIYLADQANMPYGNYYAEEKTDLLLEHIIKDAQFMLGNNYYENAEAKTAKTDKQHIKAMVIACNTATAYGQEHIDAFIEKSGLNIPVIGVINAGSRGTLEHFDKDEDGSIAVFATVGTIASKGYENTLLEMKEELGYTGDLQIYNQGGHGVAEAVDEEPDFIDRSATQPRDDYRGPSLENKDYQIDRTLMDVYDFDFDHNKMLCDSKNTDDCTILQINSSDNYVRYHLVSLMEKIRNNPNAKPLKALVLGCTHYPYLRSEINAVLAELYNYQSKGEYVYRSFMNEEIQIIDPAEYVAKELYEALKEKELFNKNSRMVDSEFFISVPNIDNANTRVEGSDRFTYDYKYGRTAGEIQEYVKVVPFSKKNISDDILDRLKTSIPSTFKLIQAFSAENSKAAGLSDDSRIQ